MNVSRFRELLKTVNRICVGQVLLMVLIVVLNDMRMGIAVLLGSAINSAWLYFSIVRRYQNAIRVTVRIYFRVLSGVMLAITLSLAMVLSLGPLENRVAIHNEGYFFFALGIIVAHQAWRGAAYVRRRWRTADDVRKSIRWASANDSSTSFARMYDLTFFFGIALSSVFIGKAFGQHVVFMISSVLLALSLPFAVAASFAAVRIVNRLIPADEPLVDEGWT